MGKFAVKETATGVKFNLLAANGQVIGVSEVYSGKEACLKGIESVKKNAEIANLFMALAISTTTHFSFCHGSNPPYCKNQERYIIEYPKS